MKKFIKECLDITIIGCWTGVFLSVIFMNLSNNDLKTIALGATFVVIYDLVENRKRKDTKRKVTLEYVVNESDDKQEEE